MKDIIEQEVVEEQPIEQQVEPSAQEPVETQPAEQPRTYTQEEVDAIVGKRLARKETTIRKEYDRQYGGLMEVLKAGTGKETVDDIADAYREFYRGQGVTVPQRPVYSAEDAALLARAEAQDIIGMGYEEVVEETERLAGIGVQNMTPREKALFKTLAEHRQAADRTRELAEMGVTKDVYESQAFRDFSGKFAPTTPIREIYDLYEKTLPKKEIKPMGSMTHTTQDNNGVKDFYSYEEAMKFTKSDFDKNPELFKAVQRSMIKW